MVTRKDLEQALSAASYPADKDALLQASEEQGAGDDTLRALRSLPPAVDYRNFDEVVSSLGVDLAP